MEAKKIYFDMDGVLADFHGGVENICHIKSVNQAYATKEQDDAIFNAIKEVEHFYDRLEPLPGALELFNRVYNDYGTKCEILTGIPKPKRGIVTAGEDKINWIHRLFAKDVKVNIVFREQKREFCNGKDYILIDDYGKNIQEWESFGGTGILHKSVQETIDELRKLRIL